MALRPRRRHEALHRVIPAQAVGIGCDPLGPRLGRQDRRRRQEAGFGVERLLANPLQPALLEVDEVGAPDRGEGGHAVGVCRRGSHRRHERHELAVAVEEEHQGSRGAARYTSNPMATTLTRQ